MRDSCQTYSSQLIDLLLTALGYGLKEVSGSQINYVTLEGHGREERLEAQNYEKLLQLDKTMGWFTSMYPIEIRTCSHLEDSISAVKSHLKEIPNKGIGYGATFGYHEPLASVSFNYLGQFEESDNNEESAFWD
ncbi:N-(5-amino-5-carboxypentanoyl)-L-cysteinyl-D-valine synthase [Folsomia candida]|uniref:N-(5-amino-5-carboxypentanoyl)-L-cysteinyl-D-valine synthase n=1 Tax=Folsomia candida TaxID=158441 RepID=A0A226CYW1_FOLCA|nr:N-(5-amino-5-carboxypentanoyl)-L-cysteinyl-D-valine synthase [Folsomia candida]